MKSSRIILFILILTIIIPTILTISNCEREENSICRQCTSGFILEKNSCLKCPDNNCFSCLRPKPNSCFQCKPGYNLINNQCGTKCSSIPHCDYCTSDLTQCIYCSNGCQISNGQCSCTSRIAIIIVCTVISIIVIAFIIFCLTNTASSRQNKLVQLALNAKTDQIEVIDNIENTKVIFTEEDMKEHNKQSHKMTELIDKRPKQLTILNNEIKSESNNNTKTIGDEKTICDYCLVESAIERLECGCFICTRHHSLVKNEEGKKCECPACHKDVTIEGIMILRCALCMNTNNVKNGLGCDCGLKICDDCFKSNLGNEKACPNC